jgi:ornithine cyclodeaminase
MTKMISFEEGEAHLDWIALTEALIAGHRLPKARIEDVLIRNGDKTLLNRSAWIDGLGLAVKCATVFPGQDPMVNGSVSLFDGTTGVLDAFVDFHLVTKWKTVGDSLLGARRLARPDSRRILIVGAGTQGSNLHAAYSALFPDATFAIWNRTQATAETFAQSHDRTTVAPDLETAVREADIVTAATMTSEPLIRGDWLQPGQHIDLIGAYRSDMREADDAALQRATVFVDSRDTTIPHIGELMIPIASGAISESDVVADFYDTDAVRRSSADEITLFKNGGGAHLDLMVARHIQELCG